MKSRKERRAEARDSKTLFEPQYNTGTRINFKGEKYIVGGAPRTYEEAYGTGYERFNNKFVTIKEVVKEDVVDTTENE